MQWACQGILGVVILILFLFFGSITFYQEDQNGQQFPEKRPDKLFFLSFPRFLFFITSGSAVYTWIT